MPGAANWQHEQSLWEKGFEFVAGVDEVGRGAWAGPVVSAAVVFPKFCQFPRELFDSKIINSKLREELAKEIYASAAATAIGVVEVDYINRFGIGKAAQKSFRLSVQSLKVVPDFFLVDAFYIKRIRKEKQLPIIHGDRLSASIAAASIIAKVYRDRLLRKLHRSFPDYGFGKNKGYGTKFHQEALQKHSLSSVHRLSFDLRAYLSEPELSANVQN
ncbi:MAG: ribonuclease HII [bacterium]|nr:ribonuclease HII [bacterium]